MTRTFDTKKEAFALISHYTKVPIEDIRKITPEDGEFHQAFSEVSEPIKNYIIKTPDGKEQKWGLSEAYRGYYLWVYTDEGIMLRM